jgi:hypothetical protein
MPQMTSMALRQKDRPFFVADGCVGGGGSYVTPPIWRSGGYQLRSGACHHPGPCGALFIVPSYQFVGSKTGVSVIGRVRWVSQWILNGSRGPDLGSCPAALPRIDRPGSAHLPRRCVIDGAVRVHSNQSAKAFAEIVGKHPMPHRPSRPSVICERKSRSRYRSSARGPVSSREASP